MNARHPRSALLLVLVIAALAAAPAADAADRALADALLAEFEAEAATTARVLERVPADRLDWRPHPTSRTLGTLARHVATLPALVTGFLAEDRLDFATVDRSEPQPASTEELLAAHAASHQALVAYLQATDDARLATPWTLENGGEAAFTLPRAAVVRSFLLSHWIHHRGQLTVYLRMLEVPVPSVYGPSRDEMPAFLAAEPAAGG